MVQQETDLAVSSGIWPWPNPVWEEEEGSGSSLQQNPASDQFLPQLAIRDKDSHACIGSSVKPTCCSFGHASKLCAWKVCWGSITFLSDSSNRILSVVGHRMEQSLQWHHSEEYRGSSIVFLHKARISTTILQTLWRWLEIKIVEACNGPLAYELIRVSQMLTKHASNVDSWLGRVLQMLMNCP